VRVIATYVRVDTEALEALRNTADWLDELYQGRVQRAQVIDIDKACDGIVWLLSRVSPPPAAPVQGGAFVFRRSLAPLISGAGGKKAPRLKAPHGPASSINPELVVEFSSWLRGIDPNELREAYKPQAMADDDVYPQIWVDEPGAALEQYLIPQLAKLTDFLSAAARAGQGVLVCFT